MELVITIGLLVGGLALLIYGADWLVSGASSVAHTWGISPLVVGLTIVAFGTSMPELTVNIYSALTGATDLAVGNVIGSNIANILLVLGLAAIVYPLSVKSSTVKWEIPLAFLASILLLVSGLDVYLDGAPADVLTRTDGFGLLALFVVFFFYVVALTKLHHTTDKDIAGDTDAKPAWLSGVLILGGLVGLVVGGKILVDQAVILATLAGLSESVIGLTVVAVGTSLPELATSVIAAMKKQVDIAVGNVVGSNIFNIFWILGVTAVITPLPIPEGFVIDASVAAVATAILFASIFIGRKKHIDRWQGWVFVALYLCYLGYLVI